ncbi:MAG TPA: copper transporter [Dermatophilaceae bacterium]|nr:copper transporter [Dermatophilaceae bacterium]
MIDFRYHLVSIVSIFLALAVGIVLGAGPLKESIGDTLTSEVTQLRQDKADLRAELDAADKGTSARDSFTAEVAPQLVSENLKGSSVAVLTLPSADAAVIRDTERVLRDSGATVASTTAVTEAWTTADAAAQREHAALADRLAREAGLAAGGSDAEPLDRVLAAALTRNAATRTGGPEADAVLTELADAGLVERDDRDTAQADFGVVVAGLVTEGDAERSTGVATRYAELSAEVDAASRGAVLVSDVGVAGAADAASVVRVARGDDATAAVLSTVDDGSIPMGRVSVAWALVQQRDGGVGHYGLDEGATAAYPPVPEP